MVEPVVGSFRARDTLQNVISGLGTYKDKTIATQYVFVPLGVPQLEAAYRGDWIARKVVDIPAQDSTRMWREWQAESDQITKLEDLEREHDIQGKVNKAITLARLYGGSALILGVEGAGTERQELDLEKVKQDSLKFVHAVHRWEIGAQETDFDIKSKNYRLPLYYTIRSGQGETLDVHWTRVIRFIGCPIPDPAQAIDGWGDSILQVVDTAIKGAGIVIGGIASLVQEAKIDVIKIPNLSERLSTKEYADKLAQRMTYANVIKSMNNALLIDSAEEWQRISTSFAALPDILQNYLICAAGAADIPATRLIGQSPKGLNATGEHDTRNYYDKIKSEQNTVLRPALNTLDEVLIRSALGSRPDEIFYEWASLWQMNETEMADLAKKKADAFQIDVSTGLIDSNALRIGRENQLIEDGTYPGLEQTLLDQESGDVPTEEEQFKNDPAMNPDHPENLAKIASAEAGAKQAEFHAKNPLAAIQEKEKAKAKVVPFQKKKVSDFNPNHDPGSGEFSSGGGSGGGGAESGGVLKYLKEKLTDPDVLKTVGKVALVGVGVALLAAGVIGGASAMGLFGATKALTESELSALIFKNLESAGSLAGAYRRAGGALGAHLHDASGFQLSEQGIAFVIAHAGLGEEHRSELEALRFDQDGNLVSGVPQVDFNPNHDPGTGEFSSGGGVSGKTGKAEETPGLASKIYSGIRATLSNPIVQGVATAALVGVAGYLLGQGLISAIGAYNVWNAGVGVGAKLSSAPLDDELGRQIQEMSREAEREIARHSFSPEQIAGAREASKRFLEKIETQKNIFRRMLGDSFDAGILLGLAPEVIDLIEKLTLTTNNRALLESLRFDQDGNLLSGAADDPHGAGDAAGDGTDDMPVPSSPPPVVITNVMPSQGHDPDLVRNITDQVTAAVLQALAAQAKTRPHQGRIKRVVRDVEHDKEGRIKRIIDTDSGDDE